MRALRRRRVDGSGRLHGARCVRADLALDTRLEIIRRNAYEERATLQHRALDVAHASLRAEIAAREHVEVDLRQAQKLEAIGRLSAGIAHEINTPLQFVTNNVEFVADGVTELLAITERVVAAVRGPRRADTEGGAEALTVGLEELRTGAFRTAMRETLDGIRRVSSIIAAMNTFAGPEGADKSMVRLDRSIEATLTMTKHETMYVADVATQLDAVPCVMCHPGEIGQVLL